MNKEKLLKILKRCANQDVLDPEEAHIKADEALLKYIDDKEITIAFENIHKWYA